MSINEILEKIKPFYTLLLLVVFSFIFFSLGRLYGYKQEQNGIRILENRSKDSALVIETMATGSKNTYVNEKKVIEPISTSSEVIGSKSGKKYYFPWCGTVKRIKLENQIHFASIEEAKRAGFTPGGNCKGLQ